MSFLSNLVAKLKGTATTIEAKGSAFAKVVETDAKEVATKGRISALDTYNKAKTDAVAFYEKEAARVHADVDTVKSKFDAVLEKL
jgi:hypothetical protein